MTTSTIEKFPDPANPSYSSGITEDDPAPAERTPAEQAVWEEAVNAAIEAATRHVLGLRVCGEPEFGIRSRLLRDVTAAIDAACLPEPEQEIEVTEAMVQAGTRAWLDAAGFYPGPDPLREAYRAMERQRIADEGAKS